MLSILIPTYNYNIYPLVTELYTQCSESGIPFEIIAIDDSPGSLESRENSGIQQLQNCIYLQNEANLGRTLTRKKLAEYAKYETLLFLDADVMPVSDSFIANYLPYINNNQVVLGGIAYKEDVVDSDHILRYKYGIYREQKPAAERNKNPYGSVLSANIIVPKTIFLRYNYSQSHNLYGMDNFFSFQLYKNHISALHIDNPVYHLGLENDTVFFKKCLESVKNRKELLANAAGIENINSLLRHYKKLKKYGLAGITALAFKISEPVLKKMILKKDPNLFCLDIYRLGYICTLK